MGEVTDKCFIYSVVAHWTTAGAQPNVYYAAHVGSAWTFLIANVSSVLAGRGPQPTVVYYRSVWARTILCTIMHEFFSQHREVMYNRCFSFHSMAEAFVSF